MAERTALTRFQLRRRTAAEFTALNEVLLQGEEGYELDTGKRKVGDGVTTWGTLPYNGGSVTSVSFVNANGITGTVTNPTTAPEITLSLGAITPTGVTTNPLRQTGNSFLRVEGSGGASPPGVTGPGFNIFQSGGTAFLEAYNYTTGAYIPIRFNGTRIIFSSTIGMRLAGLPIYADDAAAGVAGLISDDLYKTATGEVRIKL